VIIFSMSVRLQPDKTWKVIGRIWVLANTFPLSSVSDAAASEGNSEEAPPARCVVASEEVSISFSSLPTSTTPSSAAMGGISSRASLIALSTSSGDPGTIAEMLIVTGCRSALGLDVAVWEGSGEGSDC
jgi:hypothetical protein